MKNVRLDNSVRKNAQKEEEAYGKSITNRILQIPVLLLLNLSDKAGNQSCIY